MALQNGHTHAVAAFGTLLKHVSQERQRIALLAAIGRDQTPGLFMAFQYGHAKTIAAFGELLDQIQDERQRVALICATHPNGTPGPFIAFQLGHAQAIAAFGELLNRVQDEKQRVELVSAKHSNETPGLHVACINGNGEVVQAFHKLLTHVADNKARVPLIAAKRADGTPGLYMALGKGHAGVIRAFADVLGTIPETDRIVLLEARDASNISGIYRALREGKTDAVEAFVDLVKKVLSTEQGNSLLVRLYGRNAATLFKSALQTNNGDIIEAFGKPLPHLPSDFRSHVLGNLLDQISDTEQPIALLSAINENNPVDLLKSALENGNINVVRAFSTLIPNLPSDNQAQLLDDAAISTALNNALQTGITPAVAAYAEFGLIIALQRGHVATAEAFGALLAQISDAEQRDKLLSAIHDATALFTGALENGDVNVIRALGKLLPQLSAEHRASLIMEAATGALRVALQAGHVDAVEAFSLSLSQVTDAQQRGRLLALIDNDSNAALLASALENGDANTVRAFGKLIPHLPAEHQTHLLRDTAISNALNNVAQTGFTPALEAYAGFGLMIALRHGHVATAEAFSALLSQVSSVEHRDRMLATIINDRNSTAALFMNALRNNDANVIRALGKLIPHLSAEDRTSLLVNTAFRSLRPALQAGHADGVEAFGELLIQITDAGQRSGLLTAIHDGGNTTLFREALERGDADVIRAFGKMAPYLPAIQWVDLLTNAARRALHPAMQARHVDAIRAFAQISNLLAPALPPAQRKSLLNAYRASHTQQVLSIRNTRRNERSYVDLKRQHPELYAEFKVMKDALK